MGMNYGSATSAQLKAEIAAGGRSIRNVAAELGTDYTTLFKQVKGTNPIRMHTVFDVLEVLGIEPAQFFKRVQDRAESEQSPE